MTRHFIIYTFLIVLFSNLLWGQSNQSDLLIKLNADLNYFQEAIESSHPNVFQYIRKSDLDSLFVKSHFKITDSLSYTELEKKIRTILSQIGCVHTYIVKPKRKQNKIFPLCFHAINDELYVTKDFNDKLDVTKKYKVLAINGNKSKYIIKTMTDYRSSDGYNKSFKYQLINSSSWFNMMYEFYFDSDSIKMITLVDSMLDSIKVVCRMLDTTPVKDKKGIDYDTHFGDYTKIKYFEEKVALLKISSFSGLPIIGKMINDNHYKKALKEIEDKNIQTIIIDLRDNTGGDAMSGYRFVSHFINEKHKVLIQHNKGNTFKYATLKSKIGLVLNAILGNLFSGRTPQFKDGKSYVSIKPKSKIFSGDVYVLTNGLTLSTASNVTSIFKYKTNAIIAGEETGGGEKTLNAYSFPKIKLPNSKIEIQIPQYNIDLNMDGTVGSGVAPDIKLTNNFQNMISEDNWMLNKLIQIINEQKIF